MPPLTPITNLCVADLAARKRRAPLRSHPPLVRAYAHTSKRHHRELQTPADHRSHYFAGFDGEVEIATAALHFYGYWQGLFLITQVPQQHPTPRQPRPRLQQSRMQLLLQFRFGLQFGPVLGNGDAVFVRLQQLHLFAAGLGAQGEADGRFLARPEAVQVFGFKAPAKR